MCKTLLEVFLILGLEGVAYDKIRVLCIITKNMPLFGNNV